MAALGGTTPVIHVLVAMLAFQVVKVDCIAGSYSPSSCGPNGCPSVSFSTTSGLPNLKGSFTITSSRGRNGTNNYLAFAFSNTTSMEDALIVVDCYEPALNGTPGVGTSLNFEQSSGVYGNTDTPSLMSSLSDTNATKINSTLVCGFNMNFTMNDPAIYIFFAEGYMDANSTAAQPKKTRHFQRFVSTTTLQTILTPQNPTGSAFRTAQASLMLVATMFISAAFYAGVVKA